MRHHLEHLAGVQFLRSRPRKVAAGLLALCILFLVYSQTRFQHRQLGTSPLTNQGHLRHLKLNGETKHSFRPEQGLLVAASEGRHPIVDLMARAEQEWEKRLQNQSRTLEDAYHEYIRRYKRQPPRGFDVWFEWATAAKVQLLDEFDTLSRDLDVFLALPAERLRASQQEMEKLDQTFTIGKLNGSSLEVLGWRGNGYARSRAAEQLEILQNVQARLPPFTATWTAHDGPRQFFSWQLREAAKRAVSTQTYLNLTELEQQPALWGSSCAPDAPLRSYNYTQRYHNPDDFIRSQSRTFIFDHRASMDPCTTPDLVHISAYLNYPEGPWPTRDPQPWLTLSKELPAGDILGVPTEGEFGHKADGIPWREKRDARMLWRGAPTGLAYNEDTPAWNMSARLRFVQLTNRGESADAEVPVIPPPPREDVQQPIGETRWWKLSKLNKWFFDTGLFLISQCQPSVCDEMRRIYGTKPKVNHNVEHNYQYIMDMDGNGWSSRFRRLMSSNSVIFKATVFPTWWTGRAMPWLHYVPIKMDYGELYDTLAFFRGLPDGTPGHEDLAERIATAGRQWTEEFWRKEDVTAYTWRMYLEYARVMSDDRQSMNFVLDQET
ncbi:hypothetical protein BKA62DRAFT_719729 [Auriculariales sp. MPI-PUGE-AT-0066]|nr:hypothetical protein BKA62DRAFT_719729 [Auriculariales sp. MPI-PUGE-AT-0066]